MTTETSKRPHFITPVLAPNWIRDDGPPWWCQQSNCMHRAVFRTKDGTNAACLRDAYQRGVYLRSIERVQDIIAEDNFFGSSRGRA